MSVPERRAMVERPAENLSVRRQCTLLNLARSGVYRSGPATGADDLAMMRLIDELHLKWPFYGSRRMVFERARRHRIMDELLQSSPPASGDEQPVSHGGMACRHGQDRGGQDCGYAA